jgi:hypothetical protein
MCRLLLIPILFLQSCSHFDSPDLVGQYESKIFDKLERLVIFRKGTGYFTGSTLTLNPDSSYLYTTCGNIMYGQWKFDKTNNALLLYCITNKLRNDSINRVDPPTCSPKPSMYWLDNNQDLVNIVWHENGKSLDILERK